MPFIIAALALLVAIVYGAVNLYATVAARFGALAAGAAILICAALIAGLAVCAVRRYRAVHGVTVKGERRLSLTGPWGSLNIRVEQKSGSLKLAQQAARFVFSDIESAVPAKHGKTWTLVVRLRHNARAEWILPMKNGREANRWARVFSLASAQKL